MTLSALPAAMRVTETTMLSSDEVVRATMCWKLVITCAATAIGSTWGLATATALRGGPQRPILSCRT
jgi:hypothetical protein